MPQQAKDTYKKGEWLVMFSPDAFNNAYFRNYVDRAEALKHIEIFSHLADTKQPL